MSYIWFNSVLEAIGKKINFESISNLYGNSFAKDANKIISKSNPLVKHVSNGMAAFATMAANIKVIKKDKNKQAVKQSVDKQLNCDTSWAEGLF